MNALELRDYRAPTFLFSLGSFLFWGMPSIFHNPPSGSITFSTFAVSHFTDAKTNTHTHTHTHTLYTRGGYNFFG